MFRYEKEMIPILKEQLSFRHKNSHFVNEFNSGNGIADLVYTTQLEEKKELILDYELISIVMNYLNRKNKIIEIKEFYSNTFLSKKKAFGLIQFLLDGGNLEQINDENLLVKEKYSAPVKDIISIEAKLYDWKNGFYQALRYKPYSNKSYLAISQEFVHRVDKELLKENNIGLMSVSPNEVNVIINPKLEKPSNLIAHMYLAEKFYMQVFHEKTINKTKNKLQIA
ncbi:hypothetical protein [Sulfurospirillum barnesii]|uniref:Uncharacterized protein n=1 Tax=Sulfurospirillum barnesii (strain ATCC 700032 / DSM 10660 / SES-3) TaxID=760154 RepID=I3XV40_SULBS|nr:hypothetical protein [Sulfurospirillum barnesii]AFL67814.1 hypothetical protein Sulba_0496 [Sulfurospirillum barnesii SES-3]